MIALVWFLINVLSKDSGNYVSLFVDNQKIAEYGLAEDCCQAVTDASGNEILKFTINNGIVDVTGSQCPDRLCVHQKPISKSGETIVCLPQKIVLMIETSDGRANDTDNGDSLDAVTY